jgi:hypothetical protein
MEFNVSFNHRMLMIRYGTDDHRVPFLASEKGFFSSLRHPVQNGSWVHPASYLMDKISSFPGDKAAGA